jgi:hypothetical protein
MAVTIDPVTGSVVVGALLSLLTLAGAREPPSIGCGECAAAPRVVRVAALILASAPICS